MQPEETTGIPPSKSELASFKVAPVRPGRVRRGIGYALLVISTVTWFGGLLAAPWLPYSVARRAAIGGTLVVIGEITFWASIPFLGKEIVIAFRTFLNPMHWWRKWRGRMPPPSEGGISV